MSTQCTLSTPLKEVIGDRTANALKKGLGMETVEELLRHYPRRYVERGELSDIGELVEGDEATVLAEIAKVNLRRAGGRTILEVVITDGSATMTLTFFNQPWREKELRVGSQAMFAGKVSVFNNRRQLSHPDYELIPDGNDVDLAVEKFAGRFISIYPAVSRLPSWKIAQCIEITLDALSPITDYLPPSILEAVNLANEGGYPTLDEAIRAIHNPKSREEAEKSRERLTFDEALLLQILLAQRKSEMSDLSTHQRVRTENGLVQAFDNSLPWSYTEGQLEIIQEIEGDMSRTHPMHRLLQGEVGSGKTVVALRAMLTVVDGGGQAALLAPTEVLAQQHLITIRKLLGPLAEAGTLASAHSDGLGTQVTLLTGSMSAATKRAALSKIADGSAGIVIGTHALLSDRVEFKDLGLVVVDEQHRFGVEQRDALRMKAQFPPHLLVMTATPIPRTVAMTIFGDLDISTLRQLPSGRSPIQTFLIPTLEKPHYLERAWSRIVEEVAKGHQAYVVAPRISEKLVEESSSITEMDLAMAKALGEDLADDLANSKEPMTSVEELAPRLALGPLKGLKVAILHGRQSSEEKDQTMLAFGAGKIDVLVATTVIEVGVDVPNASTMVIMDADRFGVSQLHQLRGRVGRGNVAGLCLLVSNSAPETPAITRLEAVAGTLDGFELSRVDLEQRSEGDVLGKAQSGSRSHLRLLRVLRDEDLIDRARNIAISLVSQDRNLNSAPELQSLVEQLKQFENAAFMDKG